MPLLKGQQKNNLLSDIKKLLGKDFEMEKVMKFPKDIEIFYIILKRWEMPLRTKCETQKNTYHFTKKQSHTQEEQKPDKGH